MRVFREVTRVTLFCAAGSVLAACEGSGTQPIETEGAGHEAMETLPVQFRIAFMSGHVEAGLALYRAGAPDQAARHLLHPVSETHAAERAGIDALGFNPDIFRQVSTALDEGRPASEIGPMLAQAEANLGLLQDNAGGDPRTIIAYLMDVTAEEYGIGVTDGEITDPGEYQDAFGFAVVAARLARHINDDDLIAASDALVALWPDGGPLASSTPAPATSVSDAINAVRAAL